LFGLVRKLVVDLASPPRGTARDRAASSVTPLRLELLTIASSLAAVAREVVHADLDDRHRQDLLRPTLRQSG
jgi:hypothetical protein